MYRLLCEQMQIGPQAFHSACARQNPFEDDLRIRPQLRIHIESPILQFNTHVPQEASMRARVHATNGM